MAGEAAKFYEIAGIILSVMQMVFYLRLFRKYKEKLYDLADKLRGYANSDKEFYKTIRGFDEDFYRWYENLRDNPYQTCEARVLRSKGGAFLKYGDALREVKSQNKGYTPLKMVAANAKTGNVAVRMSAVRRAASLMMEHKYEDDSVLTGWNAVVTAPIGMEGDVARGYDSPITVYTNMMRGAGQGFNSAGAMFGTALYGLTHGNRNTQ